MFKLWTSFFWRRKFCPECGQKTKTKKLLSEVLLLKFLTDLFLGMLNFGPRLFLYNQTWKVSEILLMEKEFGIPILFNFT